MNPIAAKPNNANSASKTNGFAKSAHVSTGTAVDEQMQHSTHRWGARFFLVLLRAFFANVLSDLQFPEFANQPRTEH